MDKAWGRAGCNADGVFTGRTGRCHLARQKILQHHRLDPFFKKLPKFQKKIELLRELNTA
jgi:hypothetical protein